MTPILEQFISEARDFLLGIGEKLIALEVNPQDEDLMVELFRLVHTLKGNCGLFEFPEMLRVLHAAEDLMSEVREGELAYSQALADCLLEAMDLVTLQLDEIEAAGSSSARYASDSVLIAHHLRQLIGRTEAEPAASQQDNSDIRSISVAELNQVLASIPEPLRADWYVRCAESQTALNDDADALYLINYQPEPECFFKGEDPFFLVRQMDNTVWSRISSRQPWPALAELDPYNCLLNFDLLSHTRASAIDEHFRYVPDQIRVTRLRPEMLAIPLGDLNGGPVYADFIATALELIEAGNIDGLRTAASSMLELSGSGLWVASALRWLILLCQHQGQHSPVLTALVNSLATQSAPVWPDDESVPATLPAASEQAPEKALHDSFAPLIEAQLAVLGSSDQVGWLPGRLQSVAGTLSKCFTSTGQTHCLPAIEEALEAALAANSSAPLLTWLTQQMQEARAKPEGITGSAALTSDDSNQEAGRSSQVEPKDSKFSRRSDDIPGNQKTLKVDQEKIERLMNLIGEIVVSKNALPYLANRAENHFGIRELAREIKSQYAVINRIAEEMQDAIMDVRMMPVSFIFQRFPRMIRDLSRKLGKEVNLQVEGDTTEADKNIIEALADPLVHIIRNSLDHGLELPEVRRAAGKPAEGRISIRASQQADRIMIDIEDDGKGIDPLIIKRKAYEKGIIDEATLERISDQEAINLVFAAGFSTAQVVSDLSGRGVGMDVVRSAIEKVNGTVRLDSQPGKGTQIRLSLPLSVAISNVMVIESNGQIFGIPMDMVLETVRIPRDDIHLIKNTQTAILRNRLVPLRSLNQLLDIDAPQHANDANELATLIIRYQGEPVGLLVDTFREVIDIILKPMSGILSGLPVYSGSALMGDGTVLMVLNPRELF